MGDLTHGLTERDKKIVSTDRQQPPLPSAAAGDLAQVPHLRVTPAGTEACMVDVGAKPATRRMALARARVEFPSGVRDRVLAGDGPKGAVQEVARCAGVLAAKGTGSLIPMCHPLGLDHVEITFQTDGADVLEIFCQTRCEGRTGVEMEAMVGASLAALTLYDMAKGVDKGIRVGAVELLEKSGGASGHWIRD